MKKLFICSMLFLFACSPAFSGEKIKAPEYQVDISIRFNSVPFEVANEIQKEINEVLAKRKACDFKINMSKPESLSNVLYIGTGAGSVITVPTDTWTSTTIR